MGEPQQNIPISKLFPETGYLTQTAMLEIQKKGGQLHIGIPKESMLQENRVSLVPAGVATLTSRGHKVVVESGAGEKSNYTDHNFSEAGGEIAYEKEKVYEGSIILKIAPPTLEEINYMHPNQILVSPLQLPIISADYVYRLKEKRVTALAMEYIQDSTGGFPIVHIMSQLAGRSAMLTAAELMTITGGGKGVLLGGVAGVPPAKVVILGSGVVAEFAIRVAVGLGADIRVFDNDVSKLMRLQSRLNIQLNTSTMNPFQLEKELLTADVAIGAIHSKLGRTPVIVSEEMVTRMKPGAVIVDVSIDQGGCFGTSELTTHKKPTFTKHDIVHYCVPNIASRVPRTASIAVSNILTSILLRAGVQGGLGNLIYNDRGIRHGVYTYKGRLTNEYLGERFQIKATDIDLLLTSSL